MRKIRLSSIEPMDWSERLLELMASSERIANHVHMPLQSGSDAVLRRMRRRYRARHYEGRLALVSRMLPRSAVGADVMVGFPGETESDFEETRSFVERMPFTYLHVFSYSSREGTEAASLGGQVPKAVKRQRNRVLRELIEGKNLAFRRRLLGTSVSAVTLISGETGTRALTDNFVEVNLPGVQVSPGALVDIQIEGVSDCGTVGALVR